MNAWIADVLSWPIANSYRFWRHLPIAFVLVLASCATPTPTFTVGQLEDSGGRKVDGGDLTGLFAGRTHYGTYLDDQSTWVEYYAPDGRLAYVPGGRPQYGNWWVSGDEACFEYEKNDDPGPFCFYFYRLDQRIYGVDNIDRRDAQVFFVVDDMRTGDVERLAR